MLPNELLFQLNARLIEYLNAKNDLYFASITVILCGDFYQFAPVQGLPRHTAKSSIKCLINWKLFKIAGLTKVMRKRLDEKIYQWAQ